MPAPQHRAPTPPVRPATRRRLVATVPVLVLLGLGAACSGGGQEGACGEAVRERLDPTSSLHLVAGADEPDYLSDPPTSGPHLTADPPTGVVDEPIPRPLQVTHVEAGRALAQYDPDALSPAELDELEALASDRLVVAPNPDLDDAVVLTAWTWKQTCGQLDAGVVQTFTDEHVGDAPGSDF